MDCIEIIDYEGVHKEKVKALNYEWLFKYDLWEPLDDEYLDHPKEMILDKGGAIYLAKVGSDIVGTVGLVPCGNDAAEICKLCVTEKMQGQGIGRSLVEKCIEKSRSMGIKRIVLYSNTRLRSALEMYKKLGFKMTVDTDGKYEVSNVKMEMIIDKIDLNFRMVDFEKDKDILVKFRKDTQMQSFGTVDGFDLAAYMDRMRERVNKFPEGQLLIEVDNVPVGQLGMTVVEYCGKEIGYINLIYLASEYRGKGIGKDLISSAESLFRKMNLPEYHLRVSATNERAVHLYTNMGMAKLQEDDGEHPRWRMRKVL